MTSESEEKSNFKLILPEGSISYFSKSPLLKRLNSEKEKWSFLENIELQTVAPELYQLSRSFDFVNSYSQFASLISHVEMTEWLELDEIEIYSYDQSFGRIPPLSDSAEGAAAIKAHNEGDIKLALKILAGTLLSRNVSNPTLQRVKQNVPVVMSQCITASTVTKLLEQFSVKSSVTKSVNAALTDIENEVTRASELIENSEREIEQELNSSQNIHQKHKGVAERKLLFFKRLIKRGIKENDELQDRFLKQMRYRAPVALWEKRRASHAESAKNALLRFFLGAIAFCIVFGLTAIYGGPAIADAFIPSACNPEVPETCKGISPRGVLLVTATTLIASIGLWLLRFQMKVHLSERHLSLDAEERKAFAETFLALKEDKAVSEAQEAVVLQSLFRPTQDGIIKDDAAIDTSPAGLIANALSQTRKG